MSKTSEVIKAYIYAIIAVILFIGTVDFTSGYMYWSNIVESSCEGWTEVFIAEECDNARGEKQTNGILALSSFVSGVIFLVYSEMKWKESKKLKVQPELPAYQQPAYQQPAYQQPAYQQPAYQQPVHQQPVHQQPVHQQPVHQQPVHQQPVHQQPAYQQPIYQQPLNNYENSTLSDDKKNGEGSDKILLIKQLTELKEKGILSDDEFSKSLKEIMEK